MITDSIIRPFCFLLVYIAFLTDAFDVENSNKKTLWQLQQQQKHPPSSTLINRFYSSNNNYNHNQQLEHTIPETARTNTPNSNNQTLKLRRLNNDHLYSMNTSRKDDDEVNRSYHSRRSNENLTYYGMSRKNYFYSSHNHNHNHNVMHGVRSLKPTVPATNDYYNDVELLDWSTNNWMNRNTNEHGATPTIVATSSTPSPPPSTTTTTPGPLTLKHNAKNLQRFVLIFS